MDVKGVYFSPCGNVEKVILTVFRLEILQAYRSMS